VETGFNQGYQVTTGVIGILSSIASAWAIGHLLSTESGFNDLNKAGKTMLLSPIPSWGLYYTNVIFMDKGMGARSTKTKYDYEFYQYDTIYRDDEPVTNEEVLISHSGKAQKFPTNDKGIFKFNPVNDFGLRKWPDNEAINFDLTLMDSRLFTTKELPFTKPLELYPSYWMDHYAQVTAPKCGVNLSGYGQSNATVRKGMKYMVLEADVNKYQIAIFNKKGWVPDRCVKTFYSIPKKRDISEVIQQYVEDTMNQWLKQGEFEHPNDYQQRLKRKDEKLEQFTKEAMKKYQRDYAKLIDWEESTTSDYDPNNQTFKVQIPDLKEIVIKVPIDKAKPFKKHFQSDQVKFRDKNFMLVDGQWELSQAELYDPALNYQVNYNSDFGQVYNPASQFSFDLDSFNTQIFSGGETPKNLDPYNVNTNLPETNMNRPNAVAVVIGNANYKYTSPVRYAINDAQMMKTYLKEVMGFGHVIFRKNMTKGEMEGLFSKDGTVDNLLVGEESKLFVFYSGHAVPDMEGDERYLLPKDCPPKNAEVQGYPLKKLYRKLSKLDTTSVTLLMDACFSGKKVIDGVSSTIIVNEDLPTFNGVVMTAAQGDEVASWYKAKKHGLFTWFFLKAIHDYENSDLNDDGKLTYQEIYDYMTYEQLSGGLARYAGILNNNVDQHPQIMRNAKEEVLVNYD